MAARVLCLMALLSATVAHDKPRLPPAGGDMPTDESVVPAAGTADGVPADRFGLSPANTPAQNLAAMTKAFAAADSPKIRFAPGVYRLACGAFRAASAISLIGAGKTATTLQFEKGCQFNGDIFLWDSKSDVAVTDLTIDFNTPATPNKRINGLAFHAYSGDTDGLTIRNMRAINATSPVLVIAAAAAGGHRYTNIAITHNYVTLAEAAPTQNQCIALTTVNGAGKIPHAVVSYNICINTGIQVDGDYTQVVGNDISKFRFGTAIFAAFRSGKGITGDTATNRFCRIEGNVMHDSPAGLDVNNVAAGGLENSCYQSVVKNNRAYNLGGAGFFNFAAGTSYIDNLAWNNGKQGPVGANSHLNQGGFALEDNFTESPAYSSQDVTLTGNKAWDDGAGTQRFGYVEFSDRVLHVTLKDNDFARSPVPLMPSPHGSMVSASSPQKK